MIYNEWFYCLYKNNLLIVVFNILVKWNVNVKFGLYLLFLIVFIVCLEILYLLVNVFCEILFLVCNL